MARFLEIDKPDTPVYIHLMGSCLGMRYRKTFKRGSREYFEPYRNYFSTHLDDPDWINLENEGYAEKVSSNKERDVETWAITERGRKYIGEYFGVTVLDEEQ